MFILNKKNLFSLLFIFIVILFYLFCLEKLNLNKAFEASQCEPCVFD